MQGITIVSPGRMGGALAIAFSHSGLGVDTVVYRTRRRAARLARAIDPPPELISVDKITLIRSGTVILAVEDEALPFVVGALAGKVRGGAIVLHTSGSISSDILSPFADSGCETASFHPLASISSWKDAGIRFAGAYFCLEGSQKGVRKGRVLARAIGGRSFEVSGADKALYHAAALTAAGHVTALFDVAVSLMVKSGLNREMARRVLEPLLSGVAANLLAQDTPEALTGTFARGDLATLERHMRALDKRAARDEVQIYLTLAERSIDIAMRAGLDRKKAVLMRRAIKIAKERAGC